jgi:hypothetical protein
VRFTSGPGIGHPPRESEAVCPNWAKRPRNGVRSGPKWAITVTGVGFNPFRQQVKRRSDIVIVVVAILIVALLVAWAAIPR